MTDDKPADAAQEFAAWLKLLAKSPAYALEVDDPASYLGKHYDYVERTMMTCAKERDDFSLELRRRLREAIGDHSKPEETIVEVHRTLVDMLGDQR